MRNVFAKKDLKEFLVRIWNARKTAAIEANAKMENVSVNLDLLEK